MRLFDRDTRHVSLTPEGRLLEPVARGLAADVEAMYLHLRDYADRRTNKIALAAPDTGGFPEALPRHCDGVP